ncbi:MAG: hypothetical protein KKG75_03565 [Nanoarchaeota archaeon]|nr:hypothetical protein [Nanoarchaeota archaeon]
MPLKNWRSICNVAVYHGLRAIKAVSGDGGINPERVFEDFRLRPGQVKGELFSLSDDSHIVGRVLTSSTLSERRNFRLAFPTSEDRRNIGEYYLANARRTRNGTSVVYPSSVLKLEERVYPGTLRKSRQDHLFFFPEASPTEGLEGVTKVQEILEVPPLREHEVRIGEVDDLGRRELRRNLPSIPAKITYYLDPRETINFDFTVRTARFDGLEGEFPNPVDGGIFQKEDPVEIRIEYQFSDGFREEGYKGRIAVVSMSALYKEGGFNTIVINNARVERRSLYGEAKSSILTRIGRDLERARESQ